MGLNLYPQGTDELILIGFDFSINLTKADERICAISRYSSDF